MDLVTLVATCALTVDPKLMHALIWHQSGGEPWSFSVPGEPQALIYHTIREAVREVRTTLPHGVSIRIGLTGLATDSRSATLAMFIPCANISIAARQITQLLERCKAVPTPGTDPVYCAVAAYRGPWDHPDKKFADAVLKSLVKADAPNFDMPNETYDGLNDIPPQAAVAGQRASTTSPVTPDDQQRGWSSALFPARSQPFGRVSASTSSSSPDEDQPQKSGEFSAHPTTARPVDDGLFMRRLPQRRPQ
jgi:hypothetical protein